MKTRLKFTAAAATAFLCLCGPLLADNGPANPVIISKAPDGSVTVTADSISMSMVGGTNGAVNGKVTSLGVVATQLPAAVAAQLPLDKGVGLLLTHVVEGSAAARAGLQDNDVLTKFGDNVLVHPAQLQTLVENKNEGDSVNLTYIRKGREQTTTAKLESREADTPTVMAIGAAALPGANFNTDDLLKNIKVIVGNSTQDGSGDALRQQAASLVKAIGDAMPKVTTTTKIVNSMSNEATETDGGQSISIHKINGHTHLHATDNGAAVFDGDIDTPDQQSKVPPAIMSKAQTLIDELKDAGQKSAQPQSWLRSPVKTPAGV